MRASPSNELHQPAREVSCSPRSPAEDTFVPSENPQPTHVPITATSVVTPESKPFIADYEIPSSISTRGTGKYSCPLGTRCTKGGVKADGSMVIFVRNSGFRCVWPPFNTSFNLTMQIVCEVSFAKAPKALSLQLTWLHQQERICQD